MNRLSRLLPRSLVGRVYALYSSTLLLFVGSSLALFYHFEFGVEMEDAQARADTLAAVISPTVSDSAVIGDDDTIARTLDRAIDHSRFASAAFIDLKGRQVRAERHEVPEVPPPGWLTALVASRVYDTNTTIAVGGRDYGVLRLRFAPELIAGDLWRPARAALLLAALSLVGGLVLIRLPLVSWLGHLGRLRSLEQDLSSGDSLQHDALDASAPIELRQTFEVLNRAAENLQAQREQAAVTLAAIGDAVLTLDAGGAVVLANPAAGQLFGQPVPALLGRPVGQLLPEALADGGALRAWRGRRIERAGAHGPPQVLDTTLSPILSAAGLPIGHVLAGRDITEQHALDQRLRGELARREAALTALRGVLEGLSPRSAQARSGPSAPAGGDDIGAISLLISGLVASLQERSEQLNAIFSLSPDGFVSFGADRCVSYVNAAFVRLTGIAEEQVLGLDEAGFSAALAARCSPETREQWPDVDELRRAAQADGDDAAARRRAVITIERPARRVLEVGLRQGESAVLSQVCHLRDITHETEVDQMKSEFLSTAAHELRTPMASVYGFCELLLHRQPSPERQREMLQIIHRQTQRMTTILNELLDLARIEARRGTDFALRTLDLSQLVRDAVTDFQPPGSRSAPELLALTADARVRVDRNKMHQALANVLSNAYKYSPHGGPVRVRLVPGEPAVGGPADQPAEWGIRVEDAGIGMTPAQLARVSERFYRADASGSIPGTGLGMSIVKEIVGLLGGRLSLASEFGRGTQVTLWLPAVMRRAGVSPSQWGNSSLMDTA